MGLRMGLLEVDHIDRTDDHMSLVDLVVIKIHYMLVVVAEQRSLGKETKMPEQVKGLASVNQAV